MIDHTGIVVSDFQRSKTFYQQALAPIGYQLLMELSAEVTGHTDVAGFGEPPKPDFWISRGTPMCRHCILLLAPINGRWWMRFIRPLWLQVAAIMARLACGRIITRTITARLCSTRTAIISKWCATCLRKRTFPGRWFGFGSVWLW